MHESHDGGQTGLWTTTQLTLLPSGVTGDKTLPYIAVSVMYLFPMLSEALVNQQDLYRCCTYFVETPIFDAIASWFLKKLLQKL